MPKGYVVRVTVLGTELDEKLTVTALMKSASGAMTQMSSATGAAGVAMGSFLNLTGGAEEYSFTISKEGSTDVLATVPVQGKALRTHAEVTGKLRTSGMMPAGQDMLIKIPIPSLGANAALACGVDFAAGGPVTPRASAPQGKLMECCVYLAAHGILATRGAATDSFARLLLVTEGEVEWEMGRTEIVKDDLTPSWRKTLRFTYSADALANLPDALVRVEICDPMPAKDSDDKFTVMGAAQLSLPDLHDLISAAAGSAKDAVSKAATASTGLMMLETSPGAALLSMELHQKAELQGILPPRVKKQSKKEKKREAAVAKAAASASSASEDEADDGSPGGKKAKKKKKEKKVLVPAEATAKEKAKDEEKSRHLGTVLAAFELVCDSRDSSKLVITGNKLKANHCSFKRVDPYVRIFRKLSTSLEGDKKGKAEIPGGVFVPARACILKTIHHRSNRKPQWGSGLEEILLPEQMLNNTASSDATLIFEVWDNQTASKDRLIGSFEAGIAELKGGITKKLKPPHFWHGRQDLADILTCCAGLGPSGSPGTLQVKLEPGPKLDLSTHHAAFSCDQTHATMQSKKTETAEFKWTPLSQRLANYHNEVATGEEVMHKSFFKVFSRTATNFGVWWDSTTADWSRGITANSPFYQSQLRIGSEFGSAMKAYFQFFSALITLNLVLFLVQFPVWIPQVLFLTGVNPIPELLGALSAGVGTPITINASEAGSGDLDSSVNTSSLLSSENGLFYFDSYQPMVAMSTDDNGTTSYYPTGVVYLLCGFACLAVSLIWSVCRMRSKLRRPAPGVSSAAALGPGTADVLTALFGMWDHSLGYSADATSKIRREIITKIKEGEAEADRADNLTSTVRSLSERRILFIKRLVLVSIAFALCVGGVAMILLCVVPETKGPLAELIHPLFPSLAVTAINSLVPTILKILVKIEDYASPAVTLRQTTFRIFALKLVNSLAIFYGLGIPAREVPCPEKDGGATFMQLLLMDLVISALSFSVPKYITLNCLPKTIYKLKQMKKKKKGNKKGSNKTDPSTPTSDLEAAQSSPTPPPSPSPPRSPPAHGMSLPAPAPAVVQAHRSKKQASEVTQSPLPSSSGAGEDLPSPPPSPGGDDDDEEGKAWAEWKGQKKRKTPGSMKDLKPFAPDEEEEEPEAKFTEEEEEKAYQKFKTTKRRPETVATAEEDMPDEKPKKGADDPDYPLINHEKKGAPELQIPVEITKLLYRQMLLWIGMLISPFIFGLGLLSTFVLYWVQYVTCVWFHKRPKEISDHFAAGDAVRDFYSAFLVANAFAFVPFLLFATYPTNPFCGPLRSQECAVGFASNNLTACNNDAFNNRANYAWLVETLLPAPLPPSTSVFAAAAAGVNATAAPPPPPPCDLGCWFKWVFNLLISTEVLIPVCMLFLVCVIFTSAVWARSAGELREARKELAIEYKDKKMMARYAGVAI